LFTRLFQEKKLGRDLDRRKDSCRGWKTDIDATTNFHDSRF